MSLNLPVDKENKKKPPVEERIDPITEGGAAPGEGQQQLEHVVHVARHAPETAENPIRF